MNKRAFFATKIRWLKQTLLLSIVLNSAFLVIFFYFFIRENPFPIHFSYAPTPSVKEEFLTNKEALVLIEKQPFEKLATLLKDPRYIEEGIKVRDLSLALLVQEHHFDMQRALGKSVAPSRLLVRGESEPLPLFMDLTEADFQSLAYFAHIEKWPFTFYPLFHQIQEKGESADPALVQLFFQSDTFLLVERLFKSAPIPLQRKILFTLLREAKYPTLKTFMEEQKKGFDLSEKKRRDFLLHLVHDGSSTAALLLLYTDMNYAVQYLDDQSILTLLNLVPKQNQKTLLFAGKLAQSLRGNQVQARAKELLNGKEVSGKFHTTPGIGTVRPVFRARPPASLPPATEHVVQPGESLWSIAKKHNLSVEDLIRVNQLPNNNLQPGKILRIP